MSSKLLAVQIANLANARTERRDVHRPRHPKRTKTPTARRTVAVPESSWTVPVRQVRPIRSVITTTVQAIARMFAAPTSSPSEVEKSEVRQTAGLR